MPNRIWVDEDLFSDGGDLWATFRGGPGDPPQGTRFFITMRDLSEMPFCCGESEAGFEHYLRRGGAESRDFDYVGPCSEANGPHIHPGPTATADSKENT